MKIQQIINLLNDGKKPLVKLTSDLFNDSWGIKGMIARIVSYKEGAHDNEAMVIEFIFDYNEYKIHNLSLQSHDYYLKNKDTISRKTGTIFEAGLMKEDNIHESVFLVESKKYYRNGEDAPCKLFNSPAKNIRNSAKKNLLTIA